MKIKSVEQNNRRKAFKVIARNGSTFWFPYAKLDVSPSKDNPIHDLYVDRELGNEAFTIRLESGDEDSVHIDHVLEYNRDPDFISEQILYQLTLAAQERVEKSSLSKRELVRRLNTSASQFYRLLDQTNYEKSIGQMLSLLHLLDCDVELVLKDREALKS